MSETREDAVKKLHTDLAHEGEVKDCVKCENLATTLGWKTTGHSQSFLPNLRGNPGFTVFTNNLKRICTRCRQPGARDLSMESGIYPALCRKCETELEAL